MKKYTILFWAWFATPLFLTPAYAIDLGVKGPSYPVKEIHAALWLAAKKQAFIDSGKDKVMEKEVKAKAKYRIENPNGGRDLPRATTSKRTQISMERVVPRDIKDHLGRVIFQAGLTVNPLAYMPDVGLMVFYIDGRDEAQVKWALKEAKSARQSKIVLTAGQPLKLAREHERWFYFEQTGAHLKRFNITELPAKVQREHLWLVSDTVAINDKGEPL